MISERDEKDSRSYKKWTESDIERLKRLYNAANPERRSQDFFDKLAEKYGEGRSSSSIQEECRRLGLIAKRFPKSPICLNEECGVMLSPSTRIGNLCKTCYGKKWWKDNSNHKGRS